MVRPVFPTDAKVPDSGSMNAIRTGSCAELMLLRMNEQLSPATTSSLRIGLEYLLKDWNFVISNSVRFVIIV